MTGRGATLAAAVLMALGASTPAPARANEPTVLDVAGREVLVHVPPQPMSVGSRTLVIVLHGGLGNARRIAPRRSEGGLNLDAVADRDGFVVAYLNGTPVSRRLGDRFLGCNAGGGCCGLAAEDDVDDVAYVGGVIDTLVQRYGIDRTRVFGLGHSNGAMMTERVICETTLYAAAVSISGPLNIDVPRCPGASGRRVLAIHGADDQNVPIAGGVGPKGLSRIAFRSQESARRTFTDAGATYTLQVVPGADHFLDHIDAAIEKTEGVTIAEKSAAFFGLVQSTP